MVRISTFYTGGLFGFSVEQELVFHKAALRIQCAFRFYQAKRNSKQAVRRRFIKLYDSANDEYVYKDKQTQYIHLSKPKILGRRDLDSPRILVAPEDYDPGYDAVYRDGHAIVITVSTYVYNDLIPDLPVETITEHKTVCELLSHDFICKFLPENVTSLLNPTCAQVNAAFKHLRRVCKSEDFLIMYLCTHAVTAFKGEKNRRKNSYFLMHDSLWESAEDVANTSISLASLSTHLNDIMCKEKTVLLNCAHQNKLPSRLFAVKDLYPSSDSYSKLSDSANCVVIANCAIGSLLSDVISHTVLPRQENYENSSYPCSKVSSSNLSPSPTEVIPSGTKSNFKRSFFNPISAINQLKSMAPPINKNNQSSQKVELNEDIARDRKVKIRQRKLQPEIQFVKTLSPSATLVLTQRYIDDWQLNLKADRKRSVHPESPNLTWSKSEAPGVDEFSFELPTDKDFVNHRIASMLWRVRRIFGPSSNYCRERYRSIEREYRTGPEQVGLLNSSGTLFGAAFIAALRGGASTQSSPVITAETLFAFMKAHVKEGLKDSPYCHDTRDFQRGLLSPEELILANKIQIKGEKKKLKLMKAKKKYDRKKSDRVYADAMKFALKNGTKAPTRVVVEDQNIEAPALLNQCPVMMVPRTRRTVPSTMGGISVARTVLGAYANSYAVLSVVAVRCSVPPAPDKPTIVSIGPTDVLLKWSEPPFSGVPTIGYRIFFRNESRNFREWTRVPNLGNVVSTTYHIRGLTKGISYQFRVSGCNNGGWGAGSDPSDAARPGAANLPLSTAARHSRLARGGPLAILDRLQLLPTHRDEHVWGLGRLVSMAQISSGYKKGNLQKKAALAALHALQVFPDDPFIIGAALSLIGLALKGPAEEQVMKIVVQNSVAESCVGYMSKFRTNCDVIGGVTWLRSRMPEGAVPPPIDVLVKASLLAIQDAMLDESDDEKAIECSEPQFTGIFPSDYSSLHN